MRLPDPQRSYAVLIGTSTYHFSELADLPAVRRNLGALAGALTDQTLGWLPAEHCIALSDFTDVRMVYRTLRHYAALAGDTLLVYFAGHGRTGPRNELYLGLTDTDPDELRVSALPFDLIREVFSDSPAANRVLILDCCFSGRAIQDMSGPDETILGQAGIEGTYTLTSTPANAVALAPLGGHYTAFTGELITLLRTGIPDGPELLTFVTVYRQLLHTMTTLGLPLPKQRGTGTVDQLALARNPARRPHQATAHTATATSHHTWSGQSVQDGLYVQNKKTPYTFFFVLFFVAFLLEGADFLHRVVSLSANDQLDPWRLGGLAPQAGGVLAFFWLIIVFAIIVFRPFNLRIDTRGIELNVVGRHLLYRWEEINRVTVRRPPPGKAGHGIYINPAPGVAPPQKKIMWSLNFPRLEKKTGQILITPTKGFDVREIETALARFAGSRWHPAERAPGF